MSKRILVPLDGSKLAEMILPHALAYAKANEYGLTLLHVVGPPAAVTSTAWGVGPTSGLNEGWEDEIESGKHYLEEVAKYLHPYCFEVTTRVLEDEPASAIAGYADEHPEVKLIAMSTHGRSGLSRFVFGSVAEQVLHTSPVPLLMSKPAHEQDILEDIKIPHYSNLLVPLDGSEFAAQALVEAKSLVCAPGLGAKGKLTLLASAPQPLLGADLAPMPVPASDWTYEKETLANYLHHTRQNLENEGFEAEALLESGPPAEAILRAAAGTNASLIVMSTHGRTGLSRLWLGSVAMKVVHSSICPVLLVRAKERVKETEKQRAEAEAVGKAAIAPAM